MKETVDQVIFDIFGDAAPIILQYYRLICETVEQVVYDIFGDPARIILDYYYQFMEYEYRLEHERKFKRVCHHIIKANFAGVAHCYSGFDEFIETNFEKMLFHDVMTELILTSK